MFAKNIEQFDSIARKAVRVVFYDGNNRIKTIKEQVGHKGYAVGFEGLIKYLEDNLPSKEVIGKALRKMDKQDKIRACYLHACLKYVSGEHMTNQSLRERFGIEEHNYSMASRIIADAINVNMIKDYDTDNKSKKYAKYVPYWF